MEIHVADACPMQTIHSLRERLDTRMPEHGHDIAKDAEGVYAEDGGGAFVKDAVSGYVKGAGGVQAA